MAAARLTRKRCCQKSILLPLLLGLALALVLGSTLSAAAQQEEGRLFDHDANPAGVSPSSRTLAGLRRTLLKKKESNVTPVAPLVVTLQDLNATNVVNSDSAAAADWPGAGRPVPASVVHEGSAATTARTAVRSVTYRRYAITTRGTTYFGTTNFLYQPNIRFTPHANFVLSGNLYITNRAVVTKTPNGINARDVGLKVSSYGLGRAGAVQYSSNTALNRYFFGATATQAIIAKDTAFQASFNPRTRTLTVKVHETTENALLSVGRLLHGFNVRTSLFASVYWIKRGVFTVTTSADARRVLGSYTFYGESDAVGTAAVAASFTGRLV